jgi:hypothetical protein
MAEANRRNARHSTGPRTPAGKAAVALNPMKHGLFSAVSVVEGEREADLVNFGTRLRANLAPMGELELLLADRIVSTAWRLRRVAVVETEIFSDETERSERERLSWAFSNYAGEKMALLSRYETTLERSLYKALHELQRLQAARQGQAVPLPEAVDVEVSVAGRDEAEATALFGKTEGFSSMAIDGSAERLEA